MSEPPNTNDALVISKLTKLYHIPRRREKRVAVDRLDLSVPAGEIFGFLGPNGAGKTTTIKMLLGFIPPSSGEAWIFGEPVANESARRQVGFVPEQPYFPKFLTCFELAKEHGRMCGLSAKDSVSRADRCLALVGMDDVRHSPLSQLSKGMTQRVGLACALVGDPKLLILDEPSSGLDPVGRRELRELLLRFKAEGKTIFLSSHLLSEMESVCDRVAVLARGRLAACGAPEEIVEQHDDATIHFEGSVRDEVLRHQIAMWGGKVAVPELETASSATRPFSLQSATVPSRSIYSVIGLLQQRKARLVAVSQQRESLEDAFLRLIKGGEDLTTVGNAKLQLVETEPADREPVGKQEKAA